MANELLNQSSGQKMDLVYLPSDNELALTLTNNGTDNDNFKYKIIDPMPI